MLLSRLRVPKSARKKRKRIGRGVGSGHGKTSCRGSKGLFSRSGGGLRHGFEGGQMPLIRRIPKRGFTGRKEALYSIVNVGAISKIKSSDTIKPEDLKKAGLIKDATAAVKVLGTGDINKAITISAHAFSKSAIKKIADAGGKTEIIKETK